MRDGAPFTFASTLRQKTKSKLEGLPFSSMKDAVLGKEYELSLVFIGDKKSRTLNRTHRKKDYPTNVLSFPLEKGLGEIYLTIPRILVEAKNFDMTPREFAGYLFIHGLIHLKGHIHGVTMDKLESKYMRMFGLPNPHAK